VWFKERWNFAPWPLCSGGGEVGYVTFLSFYYWLVFG